MNAHSLRAGGAMALLCGRVDADTIRLVGRWKSDAMFHYLHAQALPLVRHLAPTMLTHGAFSLLPGSDLLPGAPSLPMTRFYQCLRLCSCDTKPQRSENRHFVMTSSWEPQCHHDIIMRTPRIMEKLKFSCSGGP